MNNFKFLYFYKKQQKTVYWSSFVLSSVLTVINSYLLCMWSEYVTFQVPGGANRFEFYGFMQVLGACVGRNSWVGIATLYVLDGREIESLVLDGREIESLWAATFSAPSQSCSAAHPASYAGGTGSFLGIKWPGPAVTHPPPFSAVVKGRVELYLYSHCTTS